VPFVIRLCRCLGCLIIAAAAACATPTPTQTLRVSETLRVSPSAATPDVVGTAQALLTVSFASLTPTASDTPGASETALPAASQTPLAPTDTSAPSATTAAPPTQGLRVSETLRASTRTPTPTLTPRPTPRVSPTRTVTGTATLTPTATLTATAGAPIVPGNAMSVTLAAVLGPAIISGTQVARLDQAAWAPDLCPTAALTGGSADCGTGGGDQLAAAGASGVLFASGLATGDALTATQGYTMGVWTPSLSFSTDGLALAVSSVGSTVRLFRRSDGALLFQLVQPSLRVSQVRYRPGPPGILAQDLASLGGDNTIYMWDVAYKQFLGVLSPGPSSAAALEFSGDGRWLAAAGGDNALVWDAAALPAAGWTDPVSPTITLPQAGEVTGLALSQDGFWLAAANATGTIELWTVPGGQLFATLGSAGTPAQRLAFSPDGRVLAAAYADRVIRLWSIESPGAPLAELAGHTGPITSVAFSPDGTRLASSSWDGTVRIWEVGSRQ